MEYRYEWHLMIQNTKKEGRHIVIDLAGTLEVSQQTKFKEALLKQISPDTPQVILNFKEVEFIDSACLGALIAVTRTVREKGGDVRLSGLSSEVLSIFQITRLDKIFLLFEKTSDAVKSFST